MFEIEKGIPIPDSKKPIDFPLDKMKVGDSFTVENETIRNRLRTAILRQRYSHPEQAFIVRTIGKEFRCWRIR